MSNTVTIKTNSSTKNGREVWEGVVSVPGLRPTKLVRKADNTTYFESRSAVLTSARNVAKKLGFSGVEEPVVKTMNKTLTKVCSPKTKAKAKARAKAKAVCVN